MKIILYMAISADGFIAKKNGDSDWTLDSAIFKQKVSEMGCLVVGRKTFKQFYGDLYPIQGTLNIVLANKASRQNKQESVAFVGSVGEALQIAKERGYKQLLLVGGGALNGSFLKTGLIDEVFLNVHPLILGDGIKLFEDCEVQANLELIDVKQFPAGLVQLHWRIKK